MINVKGFGPAVVMFSFDAGTFFAPSRDTGHWLKRTIMQMAATRTPIAKIISFCPFLIIDKGILRMSHCCYIITGRVYRIYLRGKGVVRHELPKEVSSGKLVQGFSVLVDLSGLL